MRDLTDYELVLFNRGFRRQGDGSWSKPPRSHREEASPEPQRPVQNVSLGAPQREAADPIRRAVVVTSYRTRLLDPDNLCPKYFIDALRYEKILDDDTAKHIELTIKQVRVKHKKDECTTLEISTI